MRSGVVPSLLRGSAECPFCRPRIDPSTGCRRFAGNNSSKSGGELRVLRYFLRNTGNMPVFSGRLQDISRDELSCPWDLAFRPIPITAISFPYHICNYPFSKVPDVGPFGRHRHCRRGFGTGFVNADGRQNARQFLLQGADEATAPKIPAAKGARRRAFCRAPCYGRNGGSLRLSRIMV